MKLQVRILSPGEFCATVLPALADREAENGLPFGMALRLAARVTPFPNALLLVVERQGSVVGGAVWTPPHDVIVTRLPPGAASLVAAACARTGHPLTGASGPEESGLELARELAAHAGASVCSRVRQRVYELSSLEDVPRAPGALRRAVPADLERIASFQAEFVREVNLAHSVNPIDWAGAAISSGQAFVWERDGQTLSLACLSFETPNGRAIGTVYTVPTARRQGYGTSLVAELAGQVLASGKRFAFLFTDDANPTSNHIYMSLGFRFICRFDSYSLITEPAAS